MLKFLLWFYKKYNSIMYKFYRWSEGHILGHIILFIYMIIALALIIFAETGMVIIALYIIKWIGITI